MDKSKPKVSIIIPSYNTSHYIEETLESVFAQTYDDYEVIVINDGAPDTEALERVLEPYRDRIVYLKQENRGLSGARNTGIRAARGEYVALLDSDDAWEPHYLEVQLGILESDPTIDVLYPDALIFGDALEAGRRSMELSPSEGEVTFESLVTQRCNVRVFVTARLETVVRAGLFDESLRSSEDFDLWVRIVKQGGRIAYHRQVLARYRRHAASLSADPIWMTDHILRVFDKAERTLPLTSSERATLARERERIRATQRIVQGKKAFFEGRIPEAIQALREGNRYFRQRKMALVILLLRVMPGALQRAYLLRDRLVYGVSTRF